MVAGRKRKRGMLAAHSTSDYGQAQPPPFAPSHLSLLKASSRPLQRTLTSGLSSTVLNLTLTAAYRLQAGDVQSAAAVLPTLLKRFRRHRNNRWFFTRELTVTGAQILRRVQLSNPEVLDDFLSHVARDGQIPVAAGMEGYSANTREAVAVERAVQLLRTQGITAALETLVEQSHDKTFKQSSLAQAFLGILALAASARDADPRTMLRLAATSLNSAAALDPDAYFFAYYAAAAAMASGACADAAHILRNFVDRRGQHARDDPIALYGLLVCLTDARRAEIDASGKGTTQERQLQQECVTISRRLVDSDPFCVRGADTLQEAHAWSWPVSPPIDTLELANIYAQRIENGGMSEVSTWTQLGTFLSQSQNVCDAFWRASGRSLWWPSHFFRTVRLQGEIGINDKLVAAKAAVARLLYEPDKCQYTERAVASGAIDLPTFSARQ